MGKTESFASLWGSSNSEFNPPCQADDGMPFTKTCILIVDDSDAVRIAVRSLLNEHKGRFEVHESPNARDAMQRARVIQPRVILLDLSLPGMSGMDFAKRIRVELPDSKIIVMSAQDPAVLQQLTALAGLELYVVKTELSAELLPLLEKIVSN
jgi:DNA-binding NarL/FixJ family response regulator